MDSKETKKYIFDIADYSFEFYKKLFVRFSCLSLIFNAPLFIFRYFLEADYKQGSQTEYLVLSLFAMIFYCIFYLVIRPLLDAYIIMKTYVTYTDSISIGIYKLKLTHLNILKRIPGVMGYMFIILAMGIIAFFLIAPAIFTLAYFMLGYDTLATLLPGVDLPLHIDFGSGIFAIFISIASFIWIGYLFTRWMFALQTMFIDNYNLVDSLNKSMDITRNSVTLASMVFLICIMFQIWVGLFLYIPILLPSVIDYFPFVVPDFMTSIYTYVILSILYAFTTVIMTMNYIHLKIKKDALGLEFKMMKLLGRQALDNKKAIDFEIDSVNFYEETKKESATYIYAGFLSRFTAFAIDVLVTGVLTVMILSGLLYLLKNDSYKLMYNVQDYLPHVLLYNYFELLNVAVLILLFVGIFTVFELFTYGQTIGKRIVGIKIVDKKGQSASILKICGRNVLRIIDFLPMLFAVGFVSMILDKQYRRVGDIVMGTIVVRTQDNAQENGEQKINIYGSNLPPQINIYPVSEDELVVLQEFLKLGNLPPARKAFFAYNLNVYFRLKFQIGDKYSNPYDFFRDIVSMNE